MMHCVISMFIISWKFYSSIFCPFPCMAQETFWISLSAPFFLFLLPVSHTQASKHLTTSSSSYCMPLHSLWLPRMPLFFLNHPHFPLPSLLILIGEGLSASRNSLLKLGGSISNLSQRSDSRVSMLLNHLLPGPSHGTSPSPIPTPQSTPPSSRHFDSTNSSPQVHLEIPEVVVSPPEEDEESEEDILDLRLGKDKYLCEWWHEQRCGYLSLHHIIRHSVPSYHFSSFFLFEHVGHNH